MKLNHLSLIVRDYAKSRDWYVANLGLKLEFEVPENQFAALEDDSGFGFLLSQGSPGRDAGDSFSIYFEVDDVDKLFARLSSKGIAFDHPPQKTQWGYGPQLRDPDGYVLRFFDHRSITK
jgi:catechol 2,3-dioxygenase-like lactoylglutathione lyase family enzyme